MKHSEKTDDPVSRKQEVHNFFFAYEATIYQEEKIVKIVNNYIKEYALTQEEIENGLNHVDARERIYKYKINKTKNDKDRISGGMFGEAILFNILKAYFPYAKKMVTKIRKRTTNKMEVNGFDCAHYSLDQNKNLTLWLGESKFYNDFSNALEEAYKSLKDHLSISKIQEEFAFLTPDLEIVSGEEKNIVQSIMRGNMDYISFEIPILLTYELKLLDICQKNEEFMVNQQVKDHYEAKFKSIISKKFADINTTINVRFKFILLPFKNVFAIKEKFIKLRDVNH